VHAVFVISVNRTPGWPVWFQTLLVSSDATRRTLGGLQRVIVTPEVKRVLPCALKTAITDPPELRTAMVMLGPAAVTAVPSIAAWPENAAAAPITELLCPTPPSMCTMMVTSRPLAHTVVFDMVAIANISAATPRAVAPAALPLMRIATLTCEPTTDTFTFSMVPFELEYVPTPRTDTPEPLVLVATFAAALRITWTEADVYGPTMDTDVFVMVAMPFADAPTPMTVAPDPCPSKTTM
jgi:hypothetical protein